MAETREKQLEEDRAPKQDPMARVLLAQDRREMRALRCLGLHKVGRDAVECADGPSLLNRLTDPGLV